MELIENFDEIKGSVTPNLKPKNEDQILFEFNTANIKRSDNDNS
jgi:hypothetical protein